MLDCTNRDNQSKPKCGTSDAGTIGTGPKFTGGFSAVNNGFVSGNQLVIAVDLKAEGDKYGGVFGVDLTTGNRKLLSGIMDDPVEGEVTKGSGPNLDTIVTVQPGPGGKWFAYTAQGSSGKRAVLSIDPKTGDRTALFEGNQVKCVGIEKAVTFDSKMAVGPDGSFYFMLNGNPMGTGKGVAKVQNGKCTVLSLSLGAEGSNKGTGPTMIGTDLNDIEIRDNALYVLQWNTHHSIIKVDLATGNRTLVSSADKGTGRDMQGNSMAFMPDGKIWTYAAYANGFSGLVAVDPGTGNRTVSEPQGRGPIARTQGADHGLWAHPDGKHLIAQYGKHLVIYDPATGNSNELSY